MHMRGKDSRIELLALYTHSTETPIQRSGAGCDVTVYPTSTATVLETRLHREISLQFTPKLLEFFVACERAYEVLMLGLFEAILKYLALDSKQLDFARDGIRPKLPQCFFILSYIKS